MNERPTGRARVAALLLLPALFALLLGAGCRREDESWRRIQESGVLRVGLDPTYPPFEDADSGELRGFDVDLARELADLLGVEAQFTYYGYDGLYDALATRQVDVLISALVIQPERTRDFAYSTPYFDAGQVLVAAQEGEISGPADLAGSVLAVELGAEGHVVALEWAHSVPGLEVRPYNTAAEALAAATAGVADAALVDHISAALYVAGNPALQRMGPVVSPEPFAAVTRIEDEQLLAELNQALAQLAESGRLQALFERWLAAESPVGVPVE